HPGSSSAIRQTRAVAEFLTAFDEEGADAERHMRRRSRFGPLNRDGRANFNSPANRADASAPDLIDFLASGPVLGDTRIRSCRMESIRSTSACALLMA